MFINPLLFFTQTRTFLQEKGKCQFISVIQKINYNIIMEVPEGYAVESIPKPIKLRQENAGLFIFNVLVQGNKIQIQVTKG
jgi:hypothetical protein